MRKYIYIMSALVCLTAYATSSSASVEPCSKTPTAADCSVAKINTRGWEDSPYMSQDGQRIYFMYNPFNFFEMFFGGEIKKLGPDRPEFSTEDPANAWSPSNTYVSTKTPDGHWSAPVRVAWDRVNGSCCAMGNAKEDTFYFPMANIGDGSIRNIVYVTRQPDGTWTKPVALGPEINSNSGDDNPHISEDGKTLYWTSTRKEGGLGGKDIWFSVRDANGAWTLARNMGPNINSSEDDDQFWVSADGRTAYYSRGTNTMVSHFDGSQWSKAEQVKFAAPLMAAEPSVTADGKTMCLAVIDPNRRDIVISLSHLDADGVWSTPVPVD